MLEVSQVHVIRHKVLVEGVPIRQVAREMSVSRNTVRKYLAEPEPARRSGGPRKRPVADLVEPRLEQIVEEWKDRTTPKQRITASQLHRELRTEGYEVGITVVQDWMRERRRKAAEVYVPLVHRPGDEAQVDFFDVTVEIQGIQRKAWMFVLRLMYSGRDFLWLYDRGDQVSFLDGHVRAFEHFGAVPQRIIYDNLSAAVRKVLMPERDLSPRFRAMASHYVFEPCFARPGTGHDKGGVEARGKGIRLRHLVPVPRGAALQEVCEDLLRRVDAEAAGRKRKDGQTVLERFAEEVPVMIPLLGPHFDPCRIIPRTISRSAVVQVDGATYSVPSHWKSLQALVHVGATTITVECRGESVTHERLHFGGKVVRYHHYLPELARKPQAVRQVAAELLSELGAPFDRLWRLLVDVHGPREAARVFARVLTVIVDQGLAPVAAAIEQALAADRLDLLSLAAHVQSEPTRTITVPASLADHEVEQARAADFDRLMSEEPS